MALAVGLLGWWLSKTPVRLMARRLLPLNVLMLLLIVLLPLTTPGAAIGRVGPWGLSVEGLRLASMVALKGNAVMLICAALLGAVDAVCLGHAMHHLRVPRKLVHLLLFTVRYLHVLHREYVRLRAAMKTRGFRPRMDRHTCRSLGYLVGMLLVRSLDRAERIVAAMKCRGFRGEFFVLDHFIFGRRDVAFSAIVSAIFVVLLMWEYT
jgi:cobalt/nickel transport system permease protein